MILKNLRSVFFIITATLHSVFSLAQNEKLESLDSLISRLEESYSITFSFDPGLVKNRRVDVSHTETFELADWITLISSNTPFNATSNGPGFYILIPKSIKNPCLTILDRADKVPLTGVVGTIKPSATYQSSNNKGQLTLEGEFKQTDSLLLSFFGYHPTSIPLHVISEGVCYDVNMESKSFAVTEVIIHGYLAEGINNIVNDHSIEIKPKDLALIPGETSGDILQSITALPGVSSPNTKAGNIHLRGSTTDQTLVYFDNIPLYNKGHYFGTISPFNQQVVENVRIYRSGSHPRLGGRVGGVIDIKSESEIPDSARYATGVTLTHGIAYAHIPVLKDKLSILVSGRYALPSSLNTPRQKTLREFINQDDPFILSFDENEVDVEELSYHYEDINAKILYKIGDSSSLSASFLHNRSIQVDKYTRLTNGSKNDNYIEGKNQGANITYNKSWSRYTRTIIHATYASYTNELNAKTFDGNTNDLTRLRYFSPSIKTVSLHLDNRTYGKKEKNFIDYGYNLDWLENIIRINTFSNGSPVKRVTADHGFVHALFGSYNIRSWKRLSLNIGSRLNYYTLTEKIYLDPRLFSNYSLTKTWSLKATYGIFHQFIHQLIFFDFNDVKPENFNWGLSDKMRPPPRSQQVTLGAIYQRDGWTADVESYYKLIEPINTSGGLNPAGGLFDFDGTAKMYGVDFLLRKQHNNLNTWISYSISEVLWNFPELEEDYINAYYDQRHNVNLGSIYRLKKWTFSGSWKLVSGVPDINAQVFQGGPPPPPGSPPFQRSITQNGRYPWHHQLDISVSHNYYPKSGKWHIATSGSIQNVYNQRTTLDRGTTLGNPYVLRTLGFSPNVQAIVYF